MPRVLRIRMLCVLKLAILIALLITGQTYAQISKEKSALPARETPVPRIDGYGHYKFGMSIEQAKEANPVAEKTDCGLFTVDFAYCLTEKTYLFGEDVAINAGFDARSKRLRQISIEFGRYAGKEGACLKAWNAILSPFIQKWEFPTRKEGTILIWESPYGGEVSLLPFCLSEDAGFIAIIYRDTPGL